MTKRKNICITINSLARGGAEKQSLLLAKALKAYHNTTVVIINPQPIYETHLKMIAKEDLNHIFLAKNPVKKIFGFTSFLKTRKIDIIFSFLPTDTLWAAICGKISGVPHILGGIRNSHIPKFKFTVLKTVHNHILDYTIANNFSAYHSAIKFGFKERLLVIFNGIEIRTPPKTRKSNNKLISIISVSRLVQQKDFNTALKAIVELKSALKGDYEINYKIVGNGPELENIIAYVEKYDLSKEIELITNPSNIYELLEASDIYLCTSTFEGISNAIMEAMNCSLPVVATHAGDNSRLVLNGENGFITALYDYKKIAEHLFNLIESSTIREQMGLKSYDYLIENFSYNAFQKNYLNIIENIKELQLNKGELVLPEESESASLIE
ncbi:MAG: glycosyltransferase [Maribacter sp.]|nr:glycosyltransferase [Maribacter sp.]